MGLDVKKWVAHRYLKGLLRDGLKAASVVLIAKGFLNPGEADGFVDGAVSITVAVVPMVVGQLMSWWDKKQDEYRVQEALQSPSYTSRQELEDAIKQK